MGIYLRKVRESSRRVDNKKEKADVVSQATACIVEKASIDLENHPAIKRLMEKLRKIN